MTAGLIISLGSSAHGAIMMVRGPVWRVSWQVTGAIMSRAFFQNALSIQVTKLLCCCEMPDGYDFIVGINHESCICSWSFLCFSREWGERGHALPFWGCYGNAWNIDVWRSRCNSRRCALTLPLQTRVTLPFWGRYNTPETLKYDVQNVKQDVAF